MNLYITILYYIWLGFLIAFLIWIFIIFVVFRIIRKFYKFPIPAYFTQLIDNPIRRKLIQKPETVAKRLKLSSGMKVMEVGPGKGSYTKKVAEEILPDGIIYAIDIQEYVINKLKEKIEEEDIPNIIPMIDDAYNLAFDDNSIDRILAITCLPEIPEPIKALKEFRRVLKPDGIISLSELFPDPDYPTRKTEKRWAEEAGLKFLEEFGNWFVYQLNFGKLE